MRAGPTGLRHVAVPMKNYVTALIPGQRPTQPDRKHRHRFDQRIADARVLRRQVQQHHEPGRSFPNGADGQRVGWPR